MTRLAYPDYLDHLRAESARFRAVLTDCDLAARVPACPDWDAADLLWHLAEVQWFWSTVIGGRPDAPDDDLVHPARPDSHAALLTTYDEYSAGLVEALAAADPLDPAWSWAPEQRVGFTYRRQAHEALIHWLDAEQTAGVVTPLDPALAADGVAEAFDVMYGGEAPGRGRIETGSHHVRVDLTDTATTLWVQPCLFFGTDPESGTNYDGPHLLLVDDPGGEPDAVVSGLAGDVDAWLWKRRGDEVVTVSGDPLAFAQLRAAISPALD